MLLFPLIIANMPEGEDRDYMEWLYIKYSRYMYRRALLISRDRTIAEDIVDEALVSLLGNIPVLRTLKEPQLLKYINVTISRKYNRLIKNKNKEYHYGSVEEFPETAQPSKSTEMEVETRERVKEMIYAIGQLSERDRQILRMKIYEETPNKEIAEVIGIAESSVGQYVRRARNNLKSKLEMYE